MVDLYRFLKDSLLLSCCPCIFLSIALRFLSPKSYYKRSDEGAGQKMELAGTRPTHARAAPGAPSPVKLRQTYSRDAFRRRTKSKYRERYKNV